MSPSGLVEFLGVIEQWICW